MGNHINATTIMRIFRGYRARKNFKQFSDAKKAWLGWDEANKFYTAPGFTNTALHKLKTVQAIEEQLVKNHELFTYFSKLCAALKIKVANQEVADSVKARMQREIHEYKALSKLMEATEIIELEKALINIQSLDLMELPEVKKVEERLAALKKQVPLLKAIDAAADTNDGEEIIQLFELVQKES